MTALLVLVLIGVLLATLQARKPAPASSGAPKRSKGPKAISPYWLLGALLLGAVLLRFGVNWLVVAGGVVLATLRSLAPLLRFLPLLSSLQGRRMGGAGWAPPGAAGPSDGSGGGAGAGHRARRMTRQEALQVFGLDESASREDVQREYRRLMRKVHPDLGGSSYLAAKINEAKDVLS